tara:strand:+ start:642 stop:971 length:330 start_codon:yes stop_codon:yes gene_type:complete
MDGYCENHKNYTMTDFNIIKNHIKNRIIKINPIDSKEKLNLFLRLIKYLLYRKPFLEKNIGLLYSMTSKMEYLYLALYNTFIYDANLENKLVNLYIEVNNVMDELIIQN